MYQLLRGARLEDEEIIDGVLLLRVVLSSPLSSLLAFSGEEDGMMSHVIERISCQSKEEKITTGRILLDYMSLDSSTRGWADGQ